MHTQMMTAEGCSVLLRHNVICPTNFLLHIVQIRKLNIASWWRGQRAQFWRAGLRLKLRIWHICGLFACLREEQQQ